MSPEAEVTLQPDTGEMTVLMAEDEAREVTLKIKQYTGVVCHLVKEAHDKQAWKALGYPTWTAYCKAEFGHGKSRSYQLVKYAEVIALGSDTTGLPESTIVDSLPEGKARKVDAAEFAALLTDAFHAVPVDADIKTRGELLAAVIEIVTAEPQEAPDPFAAGEARANENTPQKAGGDDGSDPAGDADPEEGGDGASGHDAGQTDPEPPAAPADPEGPPSDLPGPNPPGQNDDGVPCTAPDVAEPGAGEGQDPPPAPLPDDWRDRIADATYLLSLDAEDVAAVATVDDIADLRALGTWCEEFDTAAYMHSTKEQA